MYAENESGDAIFMVQPEEIGCYKLLRRVVDSVFTARSRFLTSSVVYAGMDFADEGVNRQIREMLFVPSKRRRRGMPRTDTNHKESSANEEALSAAKQTQRQSKQKERCENRLLSLLFATIYDPATKRCRLVHDVPPLKLYKTDKNGQVRTVSNYTDVRLYLRNSMTSILSAHSEAVKTLNQLLPDHYGVLLSLFMIIARAFMAIVRVNGSDESSADHSILQIRADEALDYCMNSVQDFITTWERRNFSTDNPLLKCLEAGINNAHYKSVRTLLQAMINILPPTGREPYDGRYRGCHIHTYGASSALRIDRRRDHRCLLGGKCPSKRSSTPNNFNTADYSWYISALSECVRVSPMIDFESLDGSITDSCFSTASWRCCKGLCSLHRMEEYAEAIGNHRPPRGKARDHSFTSYFEGMHWDIACFWAAIGRSNFQSWHILDQLNISDPLALKETAVELIFGGAMASIALFERVDEILPICAKLRSKKGPMVVRVGEETSDGDGYEGSWRRTENLQNVHGKESNVNLESGSTGPHDIDRLLPTVTTTQSNEDATPPHLSEEHDVAVRSTEPNQTLKNIECAGHLSRTKQIERREDISASDPFHTKRNKPDLIARMNQTNSDDESLEQNDLSRVLASKRTKKAKNPFTASKLKNHRVSILSRQQTANSDALLPSQKRKRTRESGS